MAAPAYLRHPSSVEHDTGAHPERAARIPAIEGELERLGWLGYEQLEAPPVDPSVLGAVHPPEHVERIERFAARGTALDSDTLLSEGSYVAALHSAGGAVALVDLLVGGERPTGFCGLRPPGHHATASQAMGFCLFNNVAVGARHAVDAHGLERVLVLDWDVHHGNGTNDIFHSDPRVLYASVHQSPLYPGTGRADDVGSGEGEGFTVNLPVAPGAGDREFGSLVEDVVGTIARAWRPQLVLVSAGYDAHADDPLADCAVTDAGYAGMAGSVYRAAAGCGAPFGAVLEGGYDLDALGHSVAATLEVFGADSPPGPPDVEPGPAAAEAAGRLARWWPELSALSAA